MTKPMRIAAFGFRSMPPRAGSAGADKFALELLPRLAASGHRVVAYNRLYGDDEAKGVQEWRGVEVRSLRTVSSAGFDTLLHSAKVVLDIVANNRADIVHIQNGGNSIFALFLRIFGKRTFLSQDGIDWRRSKWPWYARIFLWFSSFLTSSVHNAVIFDNVYAKGDFEDRFGRTYDFIPFGADVESPINAGDVLERLGLESGGYFLFVGRFIPDKGLHWLVEAYERLKTDKVLVLVGGSPNPSSYETTIRATGDSRIRFPGFLYGSDVHALMRHCYGYIQPSEIEGLSPVILEASFLGAPVICSDIPQNSYGLGEFGIYFRNGDAVDLNAKLAWALDNVDLLKATAAAASTRVAERFSWDKVVQQHIEIFSRA